jgi:hypothetical protein
MSNERKAANILFRPQLSIFLATGNKIKEIKRARLNGINTGLAKTITAKRPKMKANM